MILIIVTSIWKKKSTGAALKRAQVEGLLEAVQTEIVTSPMVVRTTGLVVDVVVHVAPNVTASKPPE